MSAGLIKHLKKKTEEDSNTRILMSQWEFDEKLVGKSLENVGSYYPHFSSHNESHSQQILVNIERLLGSNIDKLTATDTWLILEAAYWHDIGMLFNADEVQKVFEEDDFKEYVESLANDNTQDLHEFAKVWHEDSWNKALVNHSDPHTGVEKYRQMVAEWYRRGHAKNSNSVVLDPFEKLGISSPRTELLPKRIYRYLGQICWAHGLGFDDYVMKTLPFRQTGMGTENCHPRFVACLLRLGDLFDIDDNRFCPVMARQVGNMPSFSETHKYKHQAIREFQLDNETVSITAVCSTEMSYIECRNWFDWIREEIQNQMSQWKNIVPSRDFGLLPTINKLDVEMTDKKILLNDKPMRFSLDEKKVIELLQGNNLYHGISDVIRELLQNALDATFIRVWNDTRQNNSKRTALENGNPYHADVIAILKDYPIHVNIDLIKTTHEFKNIWKLSIVDKGTGISLEDLNHMQYMGGSSKNIRKLKNIREMPLWMQPSGTFGIGLHSAFLLHKKLPHEYQTLKFVTKSIITQDALEVKLNSPLGRDDGYCFIEKIEDNFSSPYGTTTETYFLTNTPLSSIIGMDERRLECPPQELGLSYILNDLFIREYPKIYLDEKIKDRIDNDPLYSSSITLWLDEKISWLNFKSYSLAIQVKIDDTICEKTDEGHYSSYHLFRGQEIHPTRDNHQFLNLSHQTLLYLDVYGDSKQFVSINRNAWRDSSIMSVINDIKEVIQSDNISSNNHPELIHGFEYNKKLGFKILKDLIRNKDFNSNHIGEIKFNDNYQLSEVLDIPIFLSANDVNSDSVSDALKSSFNLSEINVYPEFNDLYSKAALNYFSKNNYIIYEIEKINTNDEYSYKSKVALLFVKKGHSIHDESREFFSLGNFECQRIPELDNKELIFEDSYKISAYSLNFLSEILEPTSILLNEQVILISDTYDDYHVFRKFKQLVTETRTDYSLYSFDTDDVEKGIIFPFFIESGAIQLHDLDKITEYIYKNNEYSHIYIEDLKRQYRELIEIIRKFTSESKNELWKDFFQNYNPNSI